MAQLVSLEIKDHIADVRLDRADKMNALNADLFEQIVSIGQQLAKDPSVRAVVLSGEGKAFCAGLDLENFSDAEFNQQAFAADKAGYWPNYYQRPALVWKQIPVPVICALHGVAFGGGLQIALGADLRIAEPQTQLSIMEIRWGLIPDMGASQTLRDLIRLDQAKELTFTGKIINAIEAEAIGLISSLSETPKKAAFELARQITAQNPDAICAAKKLFDQAWHGPQQDGLKLEEDLQKQLLLSENQQEAVSAQQQKRPANFQNRRSGKSQ